MVCSIVRMVVVNNADIVSRLPPGKRYVHVGEAWVIDRSGALRRGPDPVDPPAEEPPEGLERLASEFLSAFKNHIPIFYATHIRRMLEESGRSQPVTSRVMR